ncbi:hypothetical protein HK098_006772 [Nowakowskiella sp. JEL0407]|nr:hypothetical protein HK098_006772 [Nowakowskiella sp. JEL0407]
MDIKFVGSNAFVPLLDGKYTRYVNLDNAASTPAFQCVQDSVNNYLPYYSSVHRGNGFKSLLSTHFYDTARAETLKFVNADSNEHLCIFGKNSSEAATKLARSFPITPQRNIVLVTGQEHHSSDLPFRYCMPSARVVHINVNCNGTLDVNHLQELLFSHGENIALVVVTAASNVTGVLNNIHKIAIMTHAVGGQIYVDCAQIIAHRSVYMKRLNDPEHLDYIAFSGHKMYAPFGTGVLIGRKDMFESTAHPESPGGGTVTLVEQNEVHWATGADREENGSPNTVGAIALLAAIRQIQQIGMENIAAHESELTAYALREMRKIDGVQIFGAMSDVPIDQISREYVLKQAVGAIPFQINGLNSNLVSAILSHEYGIGIRSGCFCAHMYISKLIDISKDDFARMAHAMKMNDRTNLVSLCRASFGLQNTIKDVDHLLFALRRIAKGIYQGNYAIDVRTGYCFLKDANIDFDAYVQIGPQTRTDRLSLLTAYEASNSGQFRAFKLITENSSMERNTHGSTHSQGHFLLWTNEFGGAKKKPIGSGYKRLPYNYCALSLQPAETPYCAPDGIIYDLVNILPWLKKYGINPSTGEKLTAKQLFKLNFFKSAIGANHCPITFKEFNENSHIVAIRTSGNVYSFDTVHRLNVKMKAWNDLMTGEKFTKEDIITIQDPNRLDVRDINAFFFVKNELKLEDESDETSKELKNNLNTRTMGSTGDILDKISKKEREKRSESISSIYSSIQPEVVPTQMSTESEITPSFVDKKVQPFNATHYSRGQASSAFTSMGLTPELKNERALFSEEEYMFEMIRKWTGPETKKGKPALEKSKRGKGYARIVTNLGNLNVELFCGDAPKTCYNFISLAKNGYYNGVKFHRNIKNFMIQGGDPTGTGKGGESIWKKNFEDECKTNLKHSERGTLSMANRGKDTNSSQFFIAYKACNHLDMKHTVFGKVVGGFDVLDKMESVPTGENDKPKEPITMLEIVVFVDPFQNFQNELKKKLEAEEKKNAEEEKKRIENQNRIKKIIEKPASNTEDTDVSQSGVGKYLKRNKQSNPEEESAFAVPEVAEVKKKKTKGEFGNFSNW